jgi:tetratricopeptide (TPR) repeat protein
MLGAMRSARLPAARTAARVQLAHLHATGGRLREAREDLRGAAGEGAGELLAHRAFLATVPFAGTPGDTLRRLRDELMAWDAAAEPPVPLPSAYFSTHNGLHPPIRLYLIGRVSEALRDTAALRDQAEALERLAGPSPAGTLAAALGRGLRARLLLARGRPADALGLLEPTARAGGYEPKLFSPFLSQVAERYLVGELLDSVGRDDDARAWLRSVLMFAPFDRPYAGAALVRIARIFERAGERDSAANYYARVLALWDRSDPELQPLVSEVRSALARLGAAPRR